MVSSQNMFETWRNIIFHWALPSAHMSRQRTDTSSSFLVCRFPSSASLSGNRTKGNYQDLCAILHPTESTQDSKSRGGFVDTRALGGNKHHENDTKTRDRKSCYDELPLRISDHLQYAISFITTVFLWQWIKGDSDWQHADTSLSLAF